MSIHADTAKIRGNTQMDRQMDKQTALQLYHLALNSGDLVVWSSKTCTLKTALQ